MNTIRYVPKNQSLFPRSVLGITVESLIELCYGREKFWSFAKYLLFSDVSPDWLNELLRSMYNPWGTFYENDVENDVVSHSELNKLTLFSKNYFLVKIL